MTRILFSAYFCDPYLKSEAYSAFKWLSILSEKYLVTLLTTKENEQNIVKYYNQELPKNLQIISISDNFPLKKQFHKKQLYIGYLKFIFKANKLLSKRSNILENIDVIFHRNPCSFRYFTLLHKFKKQFIIGPISGGIKPPKELASYFKSEKGFNKLRNLDKTLLKFPIYKSQYNGANKILITGEYILDIIPMIDKKKTKILLETGIECRKEPIKRENKPEINILYVGRIVKYKGLELAIKAVHQLKDYNFKFHVVGEGNEEANLKQITNELNLNDKVIFHGHVPFKEISSFYLNADIFCFPTLKEAAGNVLLEAMSYSLPIVTVNYGGPKDICSENGAIKVNIAESNEMIISIKESLKKLFDNYELRINMGVNNHKHCIENYDWTVHKERILKLFDE